MCKGENLNINDYSMKLKKHADSLASISAPIEDDDLVYMTLNDLNRKYCQFWTSIGVQETLPNFQEFALLRSEDQR